MSDPKHLAAPPIIVWGVIAAGVLLTLWVIAPEHRIELLHWKLALIVIGSYAGWFLDRMLFPNARPGEMKPGFVKTIAEVRLASMVLGSIWAMSWGL